MGQSCGKSIPNSEFFHRRHSKAILCNESRRNCAFDLCHHEIGHIKESWSLAKSGEVGQRIIVSILLKRPQLAQFFGIHSTSSVEDLSNAPRVRSHAQRLTNFVDTVISSLDECEDSKSVHQLIQHIGGLHFRKGVHFSADNWLLFKRVLLSEIVCENMKHEKQGLVENAWNKLLRSIISEMRRGFLEEALRIGSSENSAHDIPEDV